MKIIQFIKQLNNTELGKGNTHDTYILIPKSMEMNDIFEEVNKDFEFTDKQDNKYKVKLKLTKGREIRIVGLGPYYRMKELNAGDTILLEKRIQNTQHELFIDVKKESWVVFQKYGEWFESLTPDYMDNILEKKLSYKGENFTVLFKEKKQKRTDSPNQTEFYDITIGNDSIGAKYKTKDIIGIKISDDQISIKKVKECQKFTYETRVK